jgi:hypothetical protein
MTSVRAFSVESRYGLVLLLIVATYIVSIATTGVTGSAIAYVMQLLTVWIVFTVSGSRRARRIAGALLLLAGVCGVVGVTLGVVGVNDEVVAGWFYVLNVVLYLIAPVLILIHLVRRQRIDLQTFLGAIAAYLLIGMMYAFAYRGIGEIQSAPFFESTPDVSMADSLFFSFTTLTTTGFGNLVPAGNPGQSLAVMEAVAGQLFLVTAVAKVVSNWTPVARKGAARPDESA